MALSDHFPSANREILVIVQIETALGVQNVAEIAAVPGIDALFIGPSDLSQSLGVRGQMDAPVLHEAIRTVIQVTRVHGKIAGILGGSPEWSAPWIEAGVRLLAWNQEMSVFYRALDEEARLLAKEFGWTRRSGDVES
jgi:4-hydroxy-2-oxoheptanedioate aldolase